MQKKEVKAVLFDMDGTLVDSFNAWFFSYNDALKQFSFHAITRAQFKKSFGAPIERDVKDRFKGKTIKEVQGAYNKNFPKRLKLVKIFPDVRKTINTLREKKYKIALITGPTRPITDSIVKKLGLSASFDVILTMNDVKRRKPAPDMVFKACKLLKVKTKNAILVGDSVNDIIAARRANVTSVGYKIMGDYKIKRIISILKFI